MHRKCNQNIDLTAWNNFKYFLLYQAVKEIWFNHRVVKKVYLYRNGCSEWDWLATTLCRPVGKGWFNGFRSFNRGFLKVKQPVKKRVTAWTNGVPEFPALFEPRKNLNTINKIIKFCNKFLNKNDHNRKILKSWVKGKNRANESEKHHIFSSWIESDEECPTKKKPEILEYKKPDILEMKGKRKCQAESSVGCG